MKTVRDISFDRNLSWASAWVSDRLAAAALALDPETVVPRPGVNGAVLIRYRIIGPVADLVLDWEG